MKENQANAGFSNLQLKIDNLQFAVRATGAEIRRQKLEVRTLNNCYTIIQ